ncbi:MAG: DUF3857 domain-containing protein [Bacteroidales bacterium]|nr:DUF3857 domain-containing protein [Bacteroidales bacterium]
MKTKYIPLIVFAIIGASCARQPKSSEWPDADAVYLNREKIYTLNEDGSIRVREYKKQQLLTFHAVNSGFGKTDILYSPDHQSVDVILAQTITPSGDKVPVPDNGYVKMLPSSARGSKAWSSLRQLTVVHTALEPGAVIECEYTLESESEYEPYLSANELLAGQYPVNRYRIKVEIPDGISLHYHLFNLDMKPKTGRHKGFRTYTWTFNNLPAVIPEKKSNPDGKDLPRLVFSTIDSLVPLINEWSYKPEYAYARNDTMTQAVQNAISGKKSVFERILAIRDLVSQQVVTLPIPASATGYNSRPAVETWNSFAGTPAEKAILLASLIRSTGWQAYPTALVPEFYTDSLTGKLWVTDLSLLNFNLVEVPINGKNYFLYTDRPQFRDALFDHPGRVIIPLNKNLYPYRPIRFSTPENQFSLSGDLKLNRQGILKGKVQVNLIGGYNLYFKLLTDPGYARSLYPCRSAKVIMLKPDIALIDYRVDLKNAVQNLDGYHILNLPLSNRGLHSYGLQPLDSLRRTPLELEAPVRELQLLTFSLNPDWIPVDADYEYSLKNSAGRLTIRYTWENGKLTVMRNIKIPERIIQPDHYADFKALIDLWERARFKRVVFKNLH